MAIRSLSADSAPKPNATNTTAATGLVSTRLTGIAKWLLATSCLGLVVVSSTGCTMVKGLRQSFNQSECLDDFMIGFRNKSMAEKAWHYNKHRFAGHCYLREFKDGFIQGYIDVGSGGNGCTPALAPSNYWGWRYQSAQGQTAVSAWFEGFPHGAKAAEQDGVGFWRTSVSPMGMTPTVVYSPITNGDDGVADPSYFEPEYLRVPEPEPAPPVRFNREDATDPFEDDVDLNDAETVFNGAYQNFPVKADVSDVNQDWVSQLDVAGSHEAAFTSKLPDQMNNPDQMNDDGVPESAAVVIDDIFGSSANGNTDFGSEELPFSFE